MTVITERVSGWRTLWELWRAHKLSFLVTASVVMIAGLYLSLIASPNVYEAETKIVIRPAEGNPASLAGRDFASEIASPAVLEAVAEKLGPVPVSEVRRDLQVEQSERSAAGGDLEVRLFARETDRSRVARLVNLTARTWMADREEKNKSASAKAGGVRAEVARLTDSLAEITTSADSAKTALRDFQAAHAEALADAGTDPEAAVHALSEDQKKNAVEIEKVQAEITGLEGAEKLLRARLAEVPEIIEKKEVTTVRDPERVALEREIRTMERQLDEMLKSYTFRHPEVIALQTDILLKKRQLRERNSRIEDTVKSSKEQNPEYSVLKGKLDDAVVKLQLARSSLTPLASRQQSLSGRVSALREFAGPHQKLKERLADATKLQQENDALLKSRSEDLKNAMRLLEPIPSIAREAAEPSSPVGPSRSLYSTLALIASLLAGVAGMSTAYRMSRGVAGAFELERATGAPVAGTISAVAGTPADLRQRAWKHRELFAAGLVVAAAVVAIVLMAHYSGR